MNLFDLVILVLVGISVVAGLYSGFLTTMFNSLAFFLSYLLSMLFYGSIARWFQGHPDWVAQIIHYTEGATSIPTLELARTPISSLGAEQISQVVTQAQLPYPFGRLVEMNILNHALAGEGASTLADYFNNTLVYVSINLLSFVLLFLLLYAAFSIAISAASYVVRFPVLRYGDSLAGGLIGAGRGVLLALVFCSLVPIALSVLPQGIDFIDDIFAKSAFASFYLENNPILQAIRGTI